MLMTTTPGSGGSQPANNPASKSAGTSATDTDWAPADHLTTSSKPEAQQLREDIEYTRQDLGDTVDALAAKADVKSRARERARRARITAQQRMQTAQARTGEFREKARKTATDPENTAKMKKGGAAAAAGSVAITGLILARRRRNVPQLTRWDKARLVALQTATQARGRSRELSNAVMANALANQAMIKARQAAGTPDAKPRAQGAATAVGTMLVLVILRRAARRMPAAV